ncbi:MAG: DUF802 domain-containing protein [Marinobacter sp.]|uniref:DUF802 domain-containing protein n=1 Tax=Marinobacter sp. TaxID=50741 RepID=UPI0029C24E19|nr:DUF802 domain-containing protein [Marinobacter sp.]MDX5337029.1 DUF802 domain-containing protein [Marinobacter sp.]MDX5388264.1 DUF802 domain-containing protein [Marinobacter sp.]MDX5440577.1 hypothetical protein [Alteromonadaceae bacterium]MDX5473503.1 DUF802 domain-containing protein [Marinobacter sp.]
MSKLFFTLAFAIGIAVVSWIGAGFIGSDLLALAFTGLIGAVYCLGFGELVNFRRQTRQLAAQVGQLPESQDQVSRWLNTLPQPLQYPAQRRIEGHAATLPGPQITPYLTGLLVMLGLLGTFAGMIVTLGGAASALDNSTELSAIRSALAAPIAGLSLAFGTSIAGVAASAMLGLASTLSRRDRAQASRTLDTALREKLHHLSADHQRQQAFQALETQAQALPQMASAMERMTTRMEQLGQQLEQSLTRNQQEFHSTVGSHYQTLADSVANALKSALDDSAKQAAERVEPIVISAMEQLQSNARSLQKSWADDARQQLAELTTGFQKNTSEAGERWQQNLADYQQHFSRNTAELVTNQKAGLEQLVTTIGQQLSELREQESGRADASAARMESLEATVTKHLSELGTALEAPMTRLIETASETPKAAAEVIRQLQSEIARNSERENELLEERQRLVQQLDSLLENQRSTADSQRDAVASLISGAGETLTGISERFNTLIQEQSQQLGKLGNNITGSSQEVGALSDAFAQAIELFSQSNQQVVASLADIQKALDNAGTRHDEQLAYYVAQAREVIDLSVSAQKDVIDAAAALRRAEPSEAG